MRSITLAQAALFAALAMLLLTGYSPGRQFCADRERACVGSLGQRRTQHRLGRILLRPLPESFFRRTVAWITLVFAVLLEAVVAYIRFRAVGELLDSVRQCAQFAGLVASAWMGRVSHFLRVGPEHAPDSRTRKIALVLAILSAPSALSTAFDAWNSWIGFLFDDIPKEAFWRVLITPAIRIVYWLSQILFLWTAWGNPEARKSAEASFTRLAP